LIHRTSFITTSSTRSNSAAFRPASRHHLRLGTFYYGPNRPKAKLRIRAPLASPEKDAAIIHLPMPHSGPKVRVNLQEVIRANKVSDGCARIYLIYNQVGGWRSDEKMPEVDLVIYTAPLPEYREPVRLAIRTPRPSRRFSSCRVKTISWLPNVWAVAERKTKVTTKLFYWNERGEVAECTAANILSSKAKKF